MSKSKSMKVIKPYACLAADYDDKANAQQTINTEIKKIERANIHRESQDCETRQETSKNGQTDTKNSNNKHYEEPEKLQLKILKPRCRTPDYSKGGNAMYMSKP